MEDQYLVSTRRLVDTLEEQTILEALLEKTKPPFPSDPDFQGLDLLLAVPFRYPPLEYGSRFGSKIERSLWYGSLELETALAEAAFYRFLFLEQSAGAIGLVSVNFTSLTAKITTRFGLDLLVTPFKEHRNEIASRTSYQTTQKMGAAMRASGVEAVLYPSARDPAETGRNVGLFSPKAFAEKTPLSFGHWYCTFSKLSVEFVSREPSRRSVLFSRKDFVVRGKIVAPSPQ